MITPEPSALQSGLESSGRGDPDRGDPDRDDPDRDVPVHVILYHPEIPPNTGNIGRTCVALGARLWLIKPLGFEINDAQIRRSGLDYWKHLDLRIVDDWQTVRDQLPVETQVWFCSRFAQRSPWQAPMRRGDAFVFGSESSGLPPELLDPADENSLRLPTDPKVRSLNLATTAGVFLYEHHRQTSTDSQ